MYNRNQQARQIRVSVGATGRTQAAELIRQGRARRLGIGQMYCPPPGSTSGECAPQVQTCPENVKRITMPFKPDTGFTVAVLAGATARFIGNPQYLFKPDRLFIASTIGPFFDVVNFIIGNVPQSLAQGNIPAEMFSEVSTYTLMSFDQAYPGKDVILEVLNKSSVTQNFQASLVGEAIMKS